MHTLLTKAHRHRICGRACIYGILDKMVQNLFQPHRIGHDLNHRIPAKNDGMLLAFDRNDILCEGPECNRSGLFIARTRSEEHTSELQSLMRISYAVFCLKKKTIRTKKIT